MLTPVLLKPEGGRGVSRGTVTSTRSMWGCSSLPFQAHALEDIAIWAPNRPSKKIVLLYSLGGEEIALLSLSL